MENPVVVPAYVIQNYGQRQIMLSLSYLAYCGELITTANPEPAILKLINTAIPNIPPVKDWQLVWGPVTYTTPGSLYQDNLMFVAQNNLDPTQYAVAVRGTNFVSDLDWLMEDLDILIQMPWPTDSLLQPPAGALISESTSIGLQVLLAMIDPVSGTSLFQFLNTISAAPINICVTGHSLGGCLAGTLALYLKENVSLWDKSGTSNVSTITFAAPTAGNAAFATYSDAQFNGQPEPPNWDNTLGTTFDAVRCSLDVAPLSWTSTNIASTDINGNPTSTIFQLYVNYDNNGNDIGIDFTNMETPYDDVWSTYVLGFGYYGILPDILPMVAAQISKAGDYQQTVINASPIVGTVNPDFIITDSNIESTMEAFIAQATYQHSGSYPVLLNVPELADKNKLMAAGINDTVGRKTNPHLNLLVAFATKMSSIISLKKTTSYNTVD